MRSLALVVLVAFAAGGVVAPAVHRAMHAAEASAVLTAHEAAGHHHHEALDAHGAEWTPPCDRPVALDELACVLCKGLSGNALPSAPAAGDQSRDTSYGSGGCDRPEAHTRPTPPARGPPHRIV